MYEFRHFELLIDNLFVFAAKHRRSHQFPLRGASQLMPKHFIQNMYVDEEYDFLILFSNARHIKPVETAEQRNRGAQVK